MKIRTCAALLIALLSLSLLAGCSARAAEEKLDKLEDAVEHRLDTVEDAVEDAVIQAILPESAAPAPTAPPPTEALPRMPAETTPPAPAAPGEPAPPSVTEAAVRLTPEEVQAIALQHAGFTADQVQYLRTEYEIDDRVPQYEVQFREGPWEYEYEIHAETGVILSFEKDD